MLVEVAPPACGHLALGCPRDGLGEHLPSPGKQQMNKMPLTLGTGWPGSPVTGVPVEQAAPRGAASHPAFAAAGAPPAPGSVPGPGEAL